MGSGRVLGARILMFCEQRLQLEPFLQPSVASALSPHPFTAHHSVATTSSASQLQSFESQPQKFQPQILHGAFMSCNPASDFGLLPGVH